MPLAAAFLMSSSGAAMWMGLLTMLRRTPSGLKTKVASFEAGANYAVGAAQKRDVGGADGVADAVATKWSVALSIEDVAGGRIVFGLAGWADGAD